MQKLKEQIHTFMMWYGLPADSREETEAHLQHIGEASSYGIGDLVWLQIDVWLVHIVLKPPFEGPNKVCKRLGAFKYELHLDHEKYKVVHHNRLKTILGLMPPTRILQSTGTGKEEGSNASIHQAQV